MHKTIQLRVHMHLLASNKRMSCNDFQYYDIDNEIRHCSREIYFIDKRIRHRYTNTCTQAL